MANGDDDRQLKAKSENVKGKDEGGRRKMECKGSS